MKTSIELILTEWVKALYCPNWTDTMTSTWELADKNYASTCCEHDR